MRVIKSDSSGVYAYQKILKHMHSSTTVLVLWQVSPETGERSILNSRLNSYHQESGLMHFELNSGVKFKAQLPLYCYSRTGQFIFKTDIRDMKSNVFSVSFPEEIKLLEEPDLILVKGIAGADLAEAWKTRSLNLDGGGGSDIMKVKSMAERSSKDQDFLNAEFNSVSLDEEDKMFKDKRENPRARPKIDKWAKVVSETSDEIHIMKLFDLSQGGIAFISMEPNLFPKGSKIRVVGFDDFTLDDALIAQVMSHRPVDDLQIEFKIGCKFDEGQS